VNARIDELHKYQARRTAEAQRRADLRAQHESEGQRQSCADIEGAIVIARNDPEDEIGKAWLAWTAAHAHKLKLQADIPIWERAHWTEINRGRYGI
jgi:hypothetical protein